MSKGSWRQMDRKGWRCKNAYDDEAMIFNDDLGNAPVKAGRPARRGVHHQPWQRGEASAPERLYGAL